MKRRRMLLCAGLLLCLALGAWLWLRPTEPERPRNALRSLAAATYPSWWDRVQDQCRKLTGWPPAPPMRYMPLSHGVRLTPPDDTPESE